MQHQGWLWRSAVPGLQHEVWNRWVKLRKNWLWQQDATNLGWSTHKSRDSLLKIDYDYTGPFWGGQTLGELFRRTNSRFTCSVVFSLWNELAQNAARSSMTWTMPLIIELKWKMLWKWRMTRCPTTHRKRWARRCRCSCARGFVACPKTMAAWPSTGWCCCHGCHEHSMVDAC